MSKVLVADSDAALRQRLAELLSSVDHVVVEVERADAAASVLQEAPPDAVVMGAAFALAGDPPHVELIRNALDAPPPIIVAGAEPGTAGDVLRFGADDVTSAPLDPDELITRVGVRLAEVAERRDLARRADEQKQLLDLHKKLQRLLVHDLNNPLTVISGNLDYLDEILRPLLSEGAVDAFADAREATTTMTRMIENLISTSRGESGQLALERAPVAAAELLRLVVEDQRRPARQRHITVTVGEAAGLLDVDRGVVRRVVTNLLESTLRHTPPRGRVVLAARPAGDRVIIEVACNGPAIPADIAALLFDRFGPLQRPQNGPRLDFGLGLYFCRVATEAHGGRVRFEERADWPVTYVVELPAVS